MPTYTITDRIDAQHKLEAMLADYYRRICEAAEDVRISSFIVQLHMSGSANREYTLEWSVSLDGSYLGVSAPASADLEEAFVEALRRRGFNTTHQRLRITHSGDRETD